VVSAGGDMAPYANLRPLLLRNESGPDWHEHGRSASWSRPGRLVLAPLGARFEARDFIPGFRIWTSIPDEAASTLLRRCRNHAPLLADGCVFGRRARFRGLRGRDLAKSSAGLRVIR